MNRPFYRALLLGLPLAFAWRTFAEPAPAGPLTLEAAFRRALEANAGVASAAIDVERAEAQTRYFRSFVFPRVTLTGGYTVNSKEAAFGNGPDRRIIQPETDWNARLGFRQPIYAGAREWRAYKQAKLGIEQAGSALAGVENQILLAVGGEYLSVVEAEALLTVEQQNLELARRRLAQAEAFYEVGEVTEVDVLRARAGIQAVERRLVAARGEREKAAGRLRALLGLDGAIQVVDPGDFLPTLPSEAELFERAKASFPELREAQLAVNIAELEVKKQKGGILPVIYAEGGWVQQKRDFPTSDNASLTINVQVPIFTAGEVKAQVAEASERERQARLHLEDLNRRLREDLHATLLDVETTVEVRRLAAETLKTAEAEQSQAFELYRAQETTALDLDAAEVGLAEARRTAVAADIGSKKAQLAVWYFAGALKPAFVPQQGDAP